MEKNDGRLHLGFTDTGKVILRGTFFVALAALIVPAFGVLSALVAIMLMALVVGFVLRPKIQINGNLPERVIVGQITRFSYILKNTSRLPAYNLCVVFRDLPETIKQHGDAQVIPHLGPGETIEVTFEIRPARRGYYKIKRPICQSGFPFNLFNFGISYDDLETLIVLPVFYRLQLSSMGMSQKVCAGGARLAGQRSAFPEYAGNRPFLPGDSPRRIDARAWARLSVPATKEYHDDFDKRTALILDTCISDFPLLPASCESRQLEAAVSLCASVAFTINKDCLIDVLLAGNEIYQLTTLPRMLCLDKIQDILAGAKPSKGYSLEKISPVLISQFPRISEVFFILLGLNKAYRHLIGLANQAGCRCNVLLIGQSGQMPADDENMSWTSNVRYLSPDDILTGQIKSL
ncbi:MAG: DUF58 domain-containing protein [Sedimentisphaerales bacterium]|nr:DUF58 domain-containing protein [Sedimentisphaerales bacterium]